MRRRGRSNRGSAEPHFGTNNRPRIGNDDWGQLVPGVDMIEIEISCDYHGRFQARLIDKETGEVTVLTEQKNSSCEHRKLLQMPDIAIMMDSMRRIWGPCDATGHCCTPDPR
jgi:hypothetical protein